MIYRQRSPDFDLLFKDHHDKRHGHKNKQTKSKTLKHADAHQAARRFSDSDRLLERGSLTKEWGM